MAARRKVIEGPPEVGDEFKLIGPRVFDYRGHTYKLKSDPKDVFVVLRVTKDVVHATHKAQHSRHDFLTSEITLTKKAVDVPAPVKRSTRAAPKRVTRKRSS